MGTPDTPASRSCCGGSGSRDTIPAGADPRSAVRRSYGAVASGQSGVAGCCAGPMDPVAALTAIGYDAASAGSAPEAANLGLGCGNPLALAELQAGETVLDLGSGAGLDCFLAAPRVGAGGRVIGVDMTPAMVERARGIAAEHDYANVEFRLGEIEQLPVANGIVDAIISNCVINLSPDKPQVFREALRVLRPGGRMHVSDLVLTRPLEEDLKRDVGLYVGCVAGAQVRDDYVRQIREAGFEDVEVLSEGAYTVGVDDLPEGSPMRAAFDVVRSVIVRARRPR